jgi:hypothetical protein
MLRNPLLLVTSLLLLALPGRGQIETLDLPRMVARTQEALSGRITGARVFKVEPRDGDTLYFSALTVAGRSLRDGDERTLEVLYRGGFLSDEDGVFNSEAPAADDVRVGNDVVVFTAWYDDLGGGVSGHLLYAAHGGLYRAVEAPSGALVLGRGRGYAVASNVRLDDLEAAIREVAKKR